MSYGTWMRTVKTRHEYRDIPGMNDKRTEYPTLRHDLEFIQRLCYCCVKSPLLMDIHN